MLSTVEPRIAYGRTTGRGSMVTGTRARTYEEMVDALAAEGLPGAAGDPRQVWWPEDWSGPPCCSRPRRTSRRGRCCAWPPTSTPHGPDHGPVAEPMSAQPVVDRASFYISVFDRQRSPGHLPVHRRPRRRAHACHDPRPGERDVQPSPGGDHDHPDTIGPASSGRCGWMSSWPPGWSRPGYTAWT